MCVHCSDAVVCRYDFTNNNWNMEEDIDDIKLRQALPDLVLVRKVQHMICL